MWLLGLIRLSALSELAGSRLSSSRTSRALLVIQVDQALECEPNGVRTGTGKIQLHQDHHRLA